MVNRREFIKLAGLSAGSVLVSPTVFGQPNFTSNRPILSERAFSSRIIEKTIEKVSSAIKNPELAWMFQNCFPNTLDTTVDFSMEKGIPDTFVITGDIPAMWLRDSTAQVWPYLPFVNKDNQLFKLIQGVLNRQTESILIDPYANAFNKRPSGSKWESDITEMKPELHERKWEIDSLCYPVRLSYEFWKETGNTAAFNQRWLAAMKLIYKTFREQQRIDDIGPYAFMRKTQKQSDTLPLWGAGNPTRKVGLIHSMFRPSDDACIYPFLIPSNLFAAKILTYIAEMVKTIFNDVDFSNRCRHFSDELYDLINQYAVTEHLDYGKIYAYEVDGFGNQLFMDDANIPSLLALPYLDLVDSTSQTYRNTRRFLLSQDNPYFFKGTAAEGIGGPHVGLDMIWPMSIIMRAQTAESDQEILHCLKMLLNTHADTGFMHESFHKNNPQKYTREWFAWANTLFGELILNIYQENPVLLSRL